MKQKVLSVILSITLLASLLVTFSTTAMAKTDSSDAAPSLIVNLLHPDGTVTLVYEYTGVPHYDTDGTTVLYYTYPDLESFAAVEYYASIDAYPAAVGTKALGVTINNLVADANGRNSPDDVDISWSSGQKMVLYATDSADPYQGNNFYTYDFVQGQERYYYPNLVEKYTAYRASGITSDLSGWDADPEAVEPMLCLSSYQERYATDALLKNNPELSAIESLRFCMGLTPTEASNGVAGTYSSTNKFCRWAYRIDFGPVNGPALWADTTQNSQGQPIVITYSDNETWRNAVTGVTVNGNAVDSSHYSLKAGTLTLDDTVFTSDGSYFVIVISDGFMNAGVTQNINTAPIAAFSSDIRSGPAPLTVNFVDQTTNNPTSWSWDFNNDGIVDSTDQNPAYTYTSNGSYSVKLTATNSSGSDDDLKTDYITVSDGVTVWDGVSSATDWTGSGTSSDPYLISTPAQLKGLADQVNSGTTYAGIYFKLSTDINLGDYLWLPIGGHCSLPLPEEGWPTGNYFAGVFDGDNNTISGINISNPAPDTGAYGLFGYVEGGLIANLNVAGSLDMGDNSVSMIGSVVGYTTGSLYNLHSSMTVRTGDPTAVTASQAGGIAGVVRNPDSSKTLYVRYCSNSGNVTSRGRIGGIVGATYCVSSAGIIVDQCFNTGNIVSVFSSMKIFTGGIVGYSRGYISNCYNWGEMTCDNGHYMAGIAGILTSYTPEPVASMLNCYSTAVLYNCRDIGYYRWLWSSADRSPLVHIINCFWLPNQSNTDITQPNEDDSWGTQRYVSSITADELKGTAEMTESNRSGTFSGYVVPNYLGSADYNNPNGIYGFTYAGDGGYPILAWQLISDFKVDTNNLLYPVGPYSVTASVSSGSGTANVDALMFNNGGTATITISPAVDYHLSAITDNYVSVLSSVTNNTYVINNITANHTISVTFSNDTCTLTYTAGDHGSLTGSSSQTVAKYGNGSSVTAVADNGYHFAMWSDRSTTNPRVDSNIVADLAVRAIFIADDSGTPSEDYFTIAVLPDTQNYAEQYPEIFYQQTQWIADNAGSQNIVFVAHLGDVQENYSSASEWQMAYSAMNIIRAADIPYSIAPGNHDLNFTTGDPTNFNVYFPYTDFVDYPWYGGHFPENSNTSSYQLFSAMEQDFIILNLVCTPSLLTEETIAWANQVLDTYSNRYAIIVTHGYIDAIGNYLNYGSVSGGTIREEIVLSHSNVIAVLCGHSSGQYYSTDTGTHGNTIYNLLTDYQIEPVGGNGWLRLYQFYPSQNEIRALTYSPYLNQYDTSTYGQFVLSLDMSITPGDVNNDGIVDILDVVKTVNFVLGKVIPSSAEFEAADCNKDDNIDVLDVVRIVNIVLGRV